MSRSIPNSSWNASDSDTFAERIFDTFDTPREPRKPPSNARIREYGRSLRLVLLPVFKFQHGHIAANLRAPPGGVSFTKYISEFRLVARRIVRSRRVCVQNVGATWARGAGANAARTKNGTPGAPDMRIIFSHMPLAKPSILSASFGRRHSLRDTTQGGSNVRYVVFADILPLKARVRLSSVSGPTDYWPKPSLAHSECPSINSFVTKIKLIDLNNICICDPNLYPAICGRPERQEIREKKYAFADFVYIAVDSIAINDSTIIRTKPQSYVRVYESFEDLDYTEWSHHHLHIGNFTS